MRIMLCTLCLNEMEWLPSLYAQHKDWPGMVQWCFVESADITYRKTNPHRVSASGLSVDGTSEFLTNLVKQDRRITYIPFGECRASDSTQAKCQARQLYLDVAEEFEPDVLVVLDADEFYTSSHQNKIPELLTLLKIFHFKCWLLPQRHIWYPPSLVGSDKPLMEREVIQGYWKIPHCRLWRWESGMRYNSNHNWPENASGRYLTHSMFRSDGRINHRVRKLINGFDLPECIHMGFASSLVSRNAKHKYYVARGEGRTDHRQMYVDCRLAFENWKEGQPLPHDAKVIPYIGPIPEVFDVKRDISRHHKLLTSTEPT